MGKFSDDMDMGDEVFKSKNFVQYHTKLVGVTFEGRQEIIKTLKGDEPMRVRREADNQYDSNAVAVDVQTYYDKEFEEEAVEDWRPIGYIAKDKNKDIAEALDAGNEVSISLSSLTGGDDKSYGVNVYLEYEKVEAKKPVEKKAAENKPLTQGEMMESFKNMLGMVTKGSYEFTVSAVKRDTIKYKSELLNDEVELTVTNGHAAIPGNLSGSKFPEQFYQEFDKEGILDALCKKFKVKREDVEAMWKLNNEASTGYGTAIHAALENYDKNYELGHTIRSVEKKATKKNPVETMGPNKALSKNPFLKKIVQDFHNVFGGEYERLVEQFVWFGKNSGSIDRIKVVDRAKKIIRIQDFKTDGDIHDKKYQLTTSPFYKLTQGDNPQLGKELLDYHWFQLSFYAWIMQKRGWTVEGLDVYWVNPHKLIKGENPWEVFSREPLDLSGVL